MPPDPCRYCKRAGDCQVAGLVNRLAMEAWTNDREQVVCPERTEDYFKGLEGCYA